jgi:hypothetical protein
LQVYGPQNEVHYSVQRQKTGTFSLLAPTTGLYRICLSNRMSTLTEKTVAFSLHVGDELFRDVAKQGAYFIYSAPLLAHYKRTKERKKVPYRGFNQGQAGKLSIVRPSLLA